MINIKLKANKYQKNIAENNKRYLIVYGGAGAGKSYAVAQTLILRILTQKKLRILCVRKFASTLESSVIQLFRDVINDLNLWEMFTENKSRPRSITCKHTDSMLLFMGIDDREKLKSLTGITGCWVEEATEIDFDDFKQLNLRIRGKTDFVKQTILTFNPTTIENWIYQEFFGINVVNYENNFNVIKTTYLDNRFIDDEYKEKLNELKLIDEDYYNIYALGSWGSLGDLVYKPFKVQSFDFEDGKYEKWYGLDVGFTAPCALVECTFVDDCIYIRELLYKSNLTDLDLRRELIRLNVNNSNIIYVDAAAAQTIEGLKRIVDNTLGYNVRKAIKDVQPGIKLIQDAHERIIIHPESQNLLKEMKTYSWKKRAGNMTEDVIKVNDHLLDAMRYAIFSHKIIHPYIKKI